MKHFKVALIACAVLTFFVACASTNTTLQTGNSNVASTTPAPAAATPAGDELAAARATYNAACVRCHKENGEGGEVEMGEGGKLKVPSFKTGHGLNHTDVQFARQIAKGGDGMPAFEKRLSAEQIGALVRFIRKEFQEGLLKEGAPSSAH